MPNLKKEAVYAVVKRLEGEQEKIRWKLKDNLGKFRAITEEQTRLKREGAVLQELVRGLKNEP